MSNQQQDSPQKSTASSGKTVSRISMQQKALRRSMQQAGGKTVRHARRFVLSRIDSIRSAREHIIAWLIAVGVVLLAIFGQFL
ncbi:hypothetical protein EOL96_08860, partial [Candidatus Saccharibacteria bacterium]|nr:hypothetical protein [Candidatus Saccharibacteria bacterium]